MSKTARIGIIVALIVVIGFVIAAKNRGTPPPAAGDTASTPEAAVAESSPRSLPRLLELGSVGCIACQMMAPILDDIEKQYA